MTTDSNETAPAEVRDDSPQRDGAKRSFWERDRSWGIPAWLTFLYPAIFIMFFATNCADVRFSEAPFMWFLKIVSWPLLYTPIFVVIYEFYAVKYQRSETARFFQLVLLVVNVLLSSALIYVTSRVVLNLSRHTEQVEQSTDSQRAIPFAIEGETLDLNAAESNLEND